MKLFLWLIIIIFITIHISYAQEMYWRPATGLDGAQYVYALATDSSHNLFAATFQGITRSTNDGWSWEQVNDGFPFLCFQYATSIICHPNGFLFVGSNSFNSGVLRSTDGGMKWIQFNNGLGNPFVQCINIDSKGIVYVGHLKGYINLLIMAKLGHLFTLFFRNCKLYLSQLILMMICSSVHT